MLRPDIFISLLLMCVKMSCDNDKITVLSEILQSRVVFCEIPKTNFIT